MNIKPLSLFFFLAFSLGISGFAYGQTEDSAVRINDITVTTFRNEPVKKSSLNISLLDVDSLRFTGTFNITDLMARLPGVSMLSTGVAIAKPVIRGTYGNRVAVLLSGLKFDNQQWQEEHGLGISDIGIGKVEVIKGPMSVLFGSEAIGGIINLVEENKPETGTEFSDLSFKFNSNTLGGQLQAGYLRNTGKRWFRLRVGIENNADYSDGKNVRVLNSRFEGYTLKSTYGFQRKNWISNNNLFSSFNRFGFIFNDIYTFISPDNRWSRKLDVNPNHMVLLNCLASENRIKIHKSVLNLNLGIQSNKRMENEGGGQISLNMHLFTFQYLAKWDTKLSKKSNLTISHLASAEHNTNYGGRKIVPNAGMQEANLAAYFETQINKGITLENGAGVGIRRVKTFFTTGLNGPGNLIQPFDKKAGYYNVYSGISINRFNWLIKSNIASGVRMPNLAELSSNGLHEGVFTYEIGNPEFKNERVFSFNIYIGKTSKFFEFYLSPFFNQYLNYVYLAPTTETWFGFPVFKYKQQNAQQYGAEFAGIVNINRSLKAGVAISGMTSKTEDGKYTPYIPAKKISPQLTWNFNTKNKGKLNIYANADVVLKQLFVAENEIGAKQYTLINAGAGYTIQGKKRTTILSIAGTNLGNTYYFDNLSRFKNFGLYNIGRNIVFGFKTTLGRSCPVKH